jgi:hypothetical protein
MVGSVVGGLKGSGMESPLHHLHFVEFNNPGRTTSLNDKWQSHEAGLAKNS